MTAFVKSNQIVRDLLTALDGTSGTSQQLREALLRKSECDYAGQIITSLDDGEGDFPDAVRSLKQDTGPTFLHSAKRYFFNDKEAGINTAKHKFAFSQTDDFVPYELPLYGAESRDLVTSLKSIPPEYTIRSDGVLINPTPFTYIVNIKLSLIIYDGLNTPGPGHPTPTFIGVSQDSVFDLSSDVRVGSSALLEMGFNPATSHMYAGTQSYGGVGTLVLGHKIAEFKRVELNSSYMFVSELPSPGSSLFSTAGFRLALSKACCTFGARGQFAGLFKSLPANHVLIDTSNYIDVICLGFIEVPR